MPDYDDAMTDDEDEDDDGCWEQYDGEDELDDWNIDDDYDEDYPYPEFPPEPWNVRLYWLVRHALTRLVSSIKWRFRHA